MLKTYTKPGIFLIFLLLSFSIIYYLWYFKIVKNATHHLSLIGFFVDPIYCYSLLKILAEITTVSLLISATNILGRLKLTTYNIIYAVVIAEFVFILQAFAEFIWLLLYKSKANFSDFTSLSVYNVIPERGVPSFFNYALQTINLWELLYLFTLALLLKNKLNRSFVPSFGLVCLAYGVPLILWMIFATFLQIFPLAGVITSQ